MSVLAGRLDMREADEIYGKKGYLYTRENWSSTVLWIKDFGSTFSKLIRTHFRNVRVHPSIHQDPQITGDS